MWANMRIIVLLNALKVGSLRTRQMLKVDLCANGAGAYAPYAPPLQSVTTNNLIAGRAQSLKKAWSLVLKGVVRAEFN